MEQHRDTFGTAGEAVLASLLALAFAAIAVVHMIRRSNAWILILPFAWGFGQWAVASWQETIREYKFNPKAGDKAPSGESPV